MGLRRSFLQAGARSLLVGVRKVPDRETRQLMTEFYRRFLKGERKHEALRNAMLACRAARRKEHGAAHPFFWASFVLVGDPN
jgi:CHAT domain-containing protein